MTDARDILVVDDNALDRELVRRLLHPAGPPREAATAAEARAQMDAALPDLVLLDNRLPDANGVDMLPLFAERRVPVVMLTEVEAPEIIVVAMQRGAEDYLVKGTLTRDGLARAVANAIEKAALRRQLSAQHEALAAQAETLEGRNREIRALAAALSLAEQAERHRIAEFLHDDIQQLLFGARLQLQVLLSSDVSLQKELGDKVSSILEKTIQSTRNLVAELTPPVRDGNLELALQALAAQMSRLHHVTVGLAVETTGRLPSQDHRALVLQIVRELVFNAVKHAGVAQVCVRLYEEDQTLVVQVRDEGTGFNPDEVQQRPTRGFGLNSIRERLELIGGAFEIDSAPAQGTRATIRLPL